MSNTKEATISVRYGNDLVFEASKNNTLSPLDPGERAAVFHALTRALGVLVGVMPTELTDSKEAVTHECSTSIEQCHPAHKSGVVVPLRGPRGIPTETPKP